MQTLRQEGKAEAKQCIRMSLASLVHHGKAVVVMPEDSPAVKVSAVRDTYGAEARQASVRVTMTGLAVARFGSASRRKKLERRCLQTSSGNFGRSMATKRRRKFTQTRRAPGNDEPGSVKSWDVLGLWTSRGPARQPLLVCGSGFGLEHCEGMVRRGNGMKRALHMRRLIELISKEQCVDAGICQICKIAVSAPGHSSGEWPRLCWLGTLGARARFGCHRSLGLSRQCCGRSIPV